ncbi:MAG: glycosyltransferase [Nanoarchaeota archaeon]|nr:glycosyltransferase [Nanoarchaeota archaeon]
MEEVDEVPDNTKICFLGTYPPKECGIATFTRDLSQAMTEKFEPEIDFRIIALNDDANIYNYDKKVMMEINKDDIDDYISKAKEINENEDIRLICIQHEFGIFGGDYGNHLIPFLELLKKPVVVAFHSVLPNPNKVLKRIVQSLCEKSSATVVMAKKGIDILKRDYGVDEKKLFFIPHGIPNVTFVSPDLSKKRINFENRVILSTFGLLSRGKGIEYMIRALPKLVKKYPNLIYLIIGETHPVVRREEGESYRKELMKEIEKLGIKKNVKFFNKFLSLQEIIEYLSATDIYVCTNLDKNQIVSGTLSYAMGCGRVVVSTPIKYAKEFLSRDRGVVVKEKDPDSYAKKIDSLLSDPEHKQLIERNAYAYSRSMTWQNVAMSYRKLFNKVLKLKDKNIKNLPEIKLDHMKRMTNDFGMIQFCNHSEPDINSGYTIDDNSRALIAAILHHRLFSSPESLNLAKIYLKFIERCQDRKGNFQNNFKNDNEILNSHSYDSFGRTIWALGYTINKSKDLGVIQRSEQILRRSLNFSGRLKSPRSVAFAIIGLYHYYRKRPNRKLLGLIRRMADYLIRRYNEESSEDWHWFEEILSYSNSKLPEALYLAYHLTKDERYLKVAEMSLAFLSELTFIKGKIVLIGQNGWCKRNGKRSLFDQQPLDASSLVHTYLTAHSVTQNPEYYKNAIETIHWFFGKNHLNQMVYDEITGGCFDGMGEYSLNLNQGAESTLSYLLARLFLEEVNQFSKII